jgi:nucleotide-binding universal stress UspA family protein
MSVNTSAPLDPTASQRHGAYPRGSFDELIVALDGSPTSERALPVAMTLASQSTRPLSLVTVSGSRYPRYETAYLRSRAAELRGVPVAVEVLNGGSAADALVDHLYRHEHALLVMSTHARTAIGELLLGSAAEGVVRHSPRPVVLVGPRCRLPQDDEWYSDLLVCVDDCDGAQRLLPVTRAVIASLATRPTVYEVVEPLPAGPEAISSRQSSHAHWLAGELDAGGIRAAWGVGHDVLPDRAILSLAETLDRPLITLATRGRPPSGRFAATSTTVAVVREATCPVVVAGPSSGTDARYCTRSGTRVSGH